MTHEDMTTPAGSSSEEKMPMRRTVMTSALAAGTAAAVTVAAAAPSAWSTPVIKEAKGVPQAAASPSKNCGVIDSISISSSFWNYVQRRFTATVKMKNNTKYTVEYTLTATLVNKRGEVQKHQTFSITKKGSNKTISTIVLKPGESVELYVSYLYKDEDHTINFLAKRDAVCSLPASASYKC